MDIGRESLQFDNGSIYVQFGNWEDKHFLSFISDKVFFVKDKRNRLNINESRLKAKNKLWEYQNQNVWLVPHVSYTIYKI